LPDLKITTDHLKRDAYLYIRQSTPRQVTDHAESTKRQYALRDRAIAAGWPIERIHVIDCDLGKSAAPRAQARDGFQELVSEVALGKAGIVMGLEVSRLARNSVEWHRLLELCALSATLILDEDGIYDPAAFNDRLLLGLKGTMSEAELHILKARMRGGQLNKARRGELEMAPPVGFIVRGDGAMVLDPDTQVQSAIRLVFETFDRTGSAMQTVRHFREQGILFPRRLRAGPDRGTLLWGPPGHSRIVQVLHNPRYAGTYVYGRTKTRRLPDGRTVQVKVPRAEWQFVIPSAHPGYIDWDRFEANQRRLADNAQGFGGERRAGPVREGPALLQGRVVCGVCGDRMGVRYEIRREGACPVYVCQEMALRRAGNVCQTIPGKEIDAAMSRLLLELMTPMTLNATLAVQRELEARAEESDAMHRQQLERMRYDAELARRRYMKVDPDNRLVADSLEADWNDKLRRHNDAVAEYEKRGQEQAVILGEEARQRIRNLAEQFPRIWQDDRVPATERKRILRLLVEDVTLIKAEKITAHVRLTGGSVRTLVLERPRPIAQIRKFKPELVAEIDTLLDHHCDREIAEILNKRGRRTWEGKPFNLKKIAFIRFAYKLTSRFERLRRRGMLTTREVAERFKISQTTVYDWGRQGLIKKCYSDTLNRGLWEVPSGKSIIKGCRGRGARPARLAISASSSE
jgi:DNA invertase Pin-like site-specific DNA recombinase